MSLPNINSVLTLDFPNLKKYKSPRSEFADFDCPFCKKQRKFHVDYQRNVFRCNACGEAGGVLKLHQLARGIPDTKTAFRDLQNSLQNSDVQNVEPPQAREIITHPIMISVRNDVYNNLLSFLSLSDRHHADLIQRGLTEEKIVAGNYKTFPVVGFCTLAELSLWKSVNIPDLQQAIRFWNQKLPEAGVPGFFTTSDSIRIVRRGTGYFIPVRDIYGRISGMQIRYDALPENASETQKENYHKYSWFSSSEKKTGCCITGIETIHHVGFTDPEHTPETVFLTEGALKADVASALSGKPFIALIGVNNTSQLETELAYLKEHGTKEIRVCIDMDYREKPNVSKALDHIMQIISKSGIQRMLLTWDPAYKGIDDFLLENERRKEGSRRDG
jgi:ribosomal protein S27E